ncbi:hypothetical protein LSTR_LSTR016702 [Laodelphax striatellus]|uniref:Secreted protein n=1 Tax=Laodelphax striatellus TaxID=195883 RepID=A0A482XER7_LAOST|nr:hypothetical protein LSTR_LSTR016702 [Laodelphax striatellus]
MALVFFFFTVKVVRCRTMGTTDVRGALQERGLFGDHLGRRQQLAASAHPLLLSGGVPFAGQTVLECQTPQPSFLQTHSHSLGHRLARCSAQFA